MTKEWFQKFIKSTVKRQDKWILSKWNDFDEFRSEFKKGDIFTIPVNCLVPRSKIEWENSRANQSKTQEIIEVSRRNNEFNAEFIIYDGHNRLRNLIRKKIKTTKVKLID
jgi:hypothetical protein